MANVSVAAGWQLLYNRYYRKPELYQMHWRHIDLARNKVACAPFGGPIALIRDDSKIVQLYSESALRKLRIFNSAGVALSETVWNHPGGLLVGLSWTDDLTLVCVVQDGTVYLYDVCAEAVEPSFSGNVEVLLGVGDHVLLVEEDGVQQMGAGPEIPRLLSSVYICCIHLLICVHCSWSFTEG